MTRRRVLTFRDLQEKKAWPYTIQHTRRLIAAGRFPKSFKAGNTGMNLWMETEIDTYLSTRARQARKSRRRTASGITERGT